MIIDEDNRSMEVIVNDEYLSIAIGKGGQNVSLACEITGWHLEVTSEEEYSREVKLGYESLMKLDNVGLPWRNPVQIWIRLSDGCRGNILRRIGICHGDLS